MTRGTLLKKIKICQIGIFSGIQVSGFLQTESADISSDVVSRRLENEPGQIAELAKGKAGLSAIHPESGKRVGLKARNMFPIAVMERCNL
ncbi:hypothetical protein [Dyadobacter sp. NIV53]|uniref:hypothetical protein n=1 Tax=Dyadobacter sp. NIV53 TaxID=2861765 RepID=UPI001C888332|nr:hypothetical protein [Dyadobacter sp. NIV53]